MSDIVCYGEVLWDIFPNKKKVGGAPLNVAMRLNSFNHNATIISAVGKDALGNELLAYLDENNVNITCVEILDAYHTGEVNVKLNDKGAATYEIMCPRAWDKISLTEAIENTVKESDALVFGSLITRDEVSRKTLYKILKVAKYKIFDVNLRPPHYTWDILLRLMKKADFIKFNDDELYKVGHYLGSKNRSLEQNLHFIAEQTNTEHICVTKGEHGAVLLYNNTLYYNSGYKIKVVDTVGAGDSFLGALISQLLNNINPQQAINFACGVGALVAQSEGANPTLELSDIETFINP